MTAFPAVWTGWMRRSGVTRNPASLAATFVLAACGDSTGTTTPPPAPVDVAPLVEFTAVTLNTDSSFVLIRGQARDPDGEPVTLTVTSSIGTFTSGGFMYRADVFDARFSRLYVGQGSNIDVVMVPHLPR